MTARSAKLSRRLGLVVGVLCFSSFSLADAGELVGNATVRVVTANGEPWANGTLRVSGCAGLDPVPVTDGLAELKDVPAGSIYVEIRADGYAIRALQGKIVAGETVDLGQLQALTLEEGTGVIVGRVSWAGRGPAPGMSLNDLGPYHSPYRETPSGSGICMFYDNGIDVDEPFELRLDPGRHELVVMLDMPFQNSSSFGLWMRGIKTIVNVEAGVETPVEITVPALPSDVEFVGELENAWVYMLLDDATTFIQFGGLEYSYLGNIELRHLPHGLAQIAVARPLPETLFPNSRTNRRTVWENHWVEIPTVEALLELPEVRAGCLEVVWQPSDRLPEPPYCVEATPLYDDLPDEVRAVRRPKDVRGERFYSRGEVDVLYLAPGRYVIEVETERHITDETLTREVEIRHGETVRLEL